MATALVIPFAGQKPAQAFATLNPQDENLADGIGSSYGVIGYRGKTWTLRYRGEHHVFTRADDGTAAGYIDVIFLRNAKNKSKSYYPGGWQEEASIGKRPTCASLDGITPDADVQQRQANSCSICPRNEWVTNAEGRRSRACNDYKRTAVLLLPSVSKRMLGQPLMEPVFLRIPAASLNDLAIFGEAMAAQGYHFSTFITRISFDPEKAHPQMVFRPLQALTDAEGPVVLEQRETPLAKRITGEDAPRPLAVAAPAPAGTAVATGFAPAPAAAVTPPSTPAPAATVVVAPAAPAPATPTTAPEPEGVSTGFLELTANPTPAPTPMEYPKGFEGVVEGQANNEVGAHPPTATVTPFKAQTEDDVGTASESDEDLDKRIAALLPSN